MKTIWIFNHHALTPDMPGGTRHFDFAKELVGRGYKVKIFASSFHYSKYEELRVYKDTFFLEEELEGVEFIWLKTRPYKGNGLGRVLNMLDYMNKVQKASLLMQDKPDLIIGSSVHLFAVYAAYKVAAKNKVPFVMEVRDIWPETLIDMGVSKWHPFILLLGFLERFLYAKADKIITNLPYAYEYITGFGVDKKDIVWISNGIDISKSEETQAFRYEEGKFHIVYAGAIGKANQLSTLVSAASKLVEDTNIVFHIIGDGPLRKDLEKVKTSNIVFHGAVIKTQAISMIQGADLLYFPLADSPVFRFGISSNKLFDYLGSKKPILFASNARNNPVKDAEAGISIKPGNEEELIKAIKKFRSLPSSDLEKFGENGFRYVVKYFSVSFLVDKLEECLTSLVYNPIKK